METSAQPQKSLNWKNVLIGVAIGFVLIWVGVIIWWLLIQPKPKPTPTSSTSTTTTKKATSSATPSAQKDETAGWKTYTNNQLKFSLKYPSNWTKGARVEQSFDEGFRLSGPEGYIEIAWTTQWGGGCPDGYETLQLKSVTSNTCHGVGTDGSEDWSQIGWPSGDPQFTLVYADAKAYAPHEKNRVTVLKILSTLEVPTTKVQ